MWVWTGCEKKCWFWVLCVRVCVRWRRVVQVFGTSMRRFSSCIDEFLARSREAIKSAIAEPYTGRMAGLEAELRQARAEAEHFQSSGRVCTCPALAHDVVALASGAAVLVSVLLQRLRASLLLIAMMYQRGFPVCPTPYRTPVAAFRPPCDTFSRLTQRFRLCPVGRALRHCRGHAASRGIGALVPDERHP